jgi:hypothetical protein
VLACASETKEFIPITSKKVVVFFIFSVGTQIHNRKFYFGYNKIVVWVMTYKECVAMFTPFCPLRGLWGPQVMTAGALLQWGKCLRASWAQVHPRNPVLNTPSLDTALPSHCQTERQMP